MADFFVIRSDQIISWQSVLDEVGDYDFYHLPDYHRLHEKLGFGEGLLIVFREGAKLIALPLLRRSISDVPGLEEYDYYDATSVYGYPGPVFTPETTADVTFIKQFQVSLIEFAEKQRIVSFFSRLNPLLKNHNQLKGLGHVVGLNETVSINLSLPLDVQFAQYRKSHRYEVRRARRNGVTCYLDANWSSYDEFTRLYTETMLRVNAASKYYFDKKYFYELRKALGKRLHLFVAELNGEVCSAALFVHTKEIIQYHLSATNAKCMDHALSKIVIDEARIWGSSINAQRLHLGGGVNSREDSLFRFKDGFSNSRHRFYIWKWIALQDAYQDITKTRLQWLHEQGNNRKPSDFFPSYRY